MVSFDKYVMTILTYWSAYHFQYFQNDPMLKSRDRTYLPTLKAHPTQGECGSFEKNFR